MTMMISSSTQTDPELLEKLRLAAQRQMTPEEAFEQKVSWVYGQVNVGYSKDQIREILRKV